MPWNTGILGGYYLAALTPDTAATFSVRSDRMSSLVTDPLANTPYAAGLNLPRRKFKVLSYYFSDADDTEVFQIPRGVMAVAWQPTGTASNPAVTMEAAGITFSGGTNHTGWLHCMAHGSGAAVGTSTIEAPSSRGGSGYVSPLTGIYANHRSAAPNTLTSGKKRNKQGLKWQLYPFTTQTATDTWASTTSRLCPGIVSVAWQANDTTDRVAVTLNASGDVVFSSAVGGEQGFLWVWRAA